MSMIFRSAAMLSLAGLLSACAGSMQPPAKTSFDAWVAAKKVKATGMIVNGQNAPAGSYTWTVSLNQASQIADPVGSHYCDGVVYSDQWIVTAAHCVYFALPSDVIVIAGTNNLTSGGVQAAVSTIIYRQDYDINTNDNDIALLQLAAPLTLGSSISSIPLMSPSQDQSLLQSGTNMTVTGFGQTSLNSSNSATLQYANVPYIPNTTCNGSSFYNGQVTANMLCAGNAGAGTCYGDSGGPLTYQNGSTTLLAGTVSWAQGCNALNSPTVYARMSVYQSWVQGCVANPSSCNPVTD